jgi:peptidoglycan hydrolase CwlO-like protein
LARRCICIEARGNNLKSDLNEPIMKREIELKFDKIKELVSDLEEEINDLEGELDDAADQIDTLSNDNKELKSRIADLE